LQCDWWTPPQFRISRMPDPEGPPLSKPWQAHRCFLCALEEAVLPAASQPKNTSAYAHAHASMRARKRARAQTRERVRPQRRAPRSAKAASVAAAARAHGHGLPARRARRTAEVHGPQASVSEEVRCALVPAHRYQDPLWRRRAFQTVKISKGCSDSLVPWPITSATMRLL